MREVRSRDYAGTSEAVRMGAALASSDSAQVVCLVGGVRFDTKGEGLGVTEGAVGRRTAA